MELKTELDISPRILYSLKNIEKLEAIVNDYKRIIELTPEPLDPQANRRIVSVNLLSDAFSFDQRTYSVCDYVDDIFLKGRNYTVESLC